MYKRYLLSMLLICPSLNASDYDEARQAALESLAAMNGGIEKFNLNEIPHFSNNPRESQLKPSTRDELTQKAKALIARDSNANALYSDAINMQQQIIDKETVDKSKITYQESSKSKADAACADGSCIETTNEQSDDFGEGAVQMGALGDTAKDVKDKQVGANQSRIFQGGNITCRIVYGENRVNCCGSAQGMCTAGERAISRAKIEGRAIRVPGVYCSKDHWLFGCIQKRESWCIFPSKLAKIVQYHGRSQKGLNFGYADGKDNMANCRGLTPEEVSTINFDDAQMKQSLASLEEDYKSKKQLEAKSTTIERTRKHANSNQGVFNDFQG